MLDPMANARYAAAFLDDLHAEFGDWTQAVAAYHSRNPDHAARYLARYRAIRAELPDTPALRPASGPAPLQMAARPPLASAARPTATGGLGALILSAVPPLDRGDGP
jgi:hypothetical protein